MSDPDHHQTDAQADDQDGYDHAAIESRWQRAWREAGTFRAEDPDPILDEPGTYVLGTFPSAAGPLGGDQLRIRAITDAYARYRRMCGDDVLHPIGWDAFGPAAERAADRRGGDPAERTGDRIASMREVLAALGIGYDPERTVTTCDPAFYRWTQWLFKRLHEAGLVDRREATVDWCPECETTVAGEAGTARTPDGEEGGCRRCGTPVEDRERDRWFFTITDYADDLLAGLDDLAAWPDGVRERQRERIGRREGAIVSFAIDGRGRLAAFTTRPDALAGATFLAVAPDHRLARTLAADDADVAAYVEAAGDDGNGDGEPTGVFAGVEARNPLTDEELPVYVAEYAGDGTGATVGVPAHDERDHAFARAHELPIRPVVAPVDAGGAVDRDVYAGTGVVTAGPYEGLSSAEARDRTVEEHDAIDARVEYRLRDWRVSRGRYWGTPIPVVRCPDCGPVLVPDEELPVELPEYVDAPGNPIEAVDEFVHTYCPDCGSPARRETETMDASVDAAWSFLRAIDPDNERVPVDYDRAAGWLPVDRYVCGADRATDHLLHARFFTRALADLRMVEIEEPFAGLLVPGPVRPDGTPSGSGDVDLGEAVAAHGADAVRLFVLETAGPERALDWSDRGVAAARRFLETVHRRARTAGDADAREDDPDAAAREHVAREIDATIAAATGAYEAFAFDRALGEVRSLVSLLDRYREAAVADDPAVRRRGLRAVTGLLAPVAPHVAEECRADLGEAAPLAEAPWPAPERDVDRGTRAAERDLVERTRSAVRRAVDDAGIDDPGTVRLVVAPEWKRRALALAREARADDAAVIDAVMADESIRERGEAAAAYVATLAEGDDAAGGTLSAAAEREALVRAAWLLRSEFGADVRVERAENVDDALAREARPGRPGVGVAPA